MYIATAKKDAQDVHYPTVLHLLYYGPPKNQTAHHKSARKQAYENVARAPPSPPPLTPLSERHHILAPRRADHPDEFKSAT